MVWSDGMLWYGMIWYGMVLVQLPNGHIQLKRVLALLSRTAQRRSAVVTNGLFSRRPNPAASSVVRSIYQDSSEKGRVETAMKRFAIEESR